jgi:hypothetical protein
VEDDRLLGDALSAGWRQTGEVVDWFRSGEPADDALDGASYMIASRGRRRSVTTGTLAPPGARPVLQGAGATPGSRPAPIEWHLLVTLVTDMAAPELQSCRRTKRSMGRVSGPRGGSREHGGSGFHLKALHGTTGSTARTRMAGASRTAWTTMCGW